MTYFNSPKGILFGFIIWRDVVVISHTSIKTMEGKYRRTTFPECMMNNIALIVKLRELLVIFMHSRTLPEKAADALRYCQENIPLADLPIGAYGEYCEIYEQIVFLSDDKSRTAPDDLLRSGGDLILSILMLYEQVAAYIAVEEFMHKQNRFNE
ncbi:hypothetical protein MXL85_22435 [Klebsiella oxytoca]|nr:hypothetical protein [Klebsiella oxytoca]MCW9543170.1 hypothetical protein [Klebsiella oxytoca]MCW9565544.1 hypothetical protein [Klebsiella oxytoca]MCW9576085.1 hypothetical protein [Klebsiella oxytoca]MEB6477266.1 hypothetical protein [Klebsiella oxytoca]MEB6495751.1 hypothetical protein [Klebsiella oxytoca]